jgi:hypothetical protein
MQIIGLALTLLCFAGGLAPAPDSATYAINDPDPTAGNVMRAAPERRGQDPRLVAESWLRAQGLASMGEVSR